MTTESNFVGQRKASYFKPVEAFALKKSIERDAQEELDEYARFEARELGTGGRDIGLDDAAQDSSDFADALPASGKRNLANTYVWTSDGGLHAETTETLDQISESVGGTHSFVDEGGSPCRHFANTGVLDDLKRSPAGPALAKRRQEPS